MGWGRDGKFRDFMQQVENLGVGCRGSVSCRPASSALLLTCEGGTHTGGRGRERGPLPEEWRGMYEVQSTTCRMRMDEEADDDDDDEEWLQRPQCTRAWITKNIA